MKHSQASKRMAILVLAAGRSARMGRPKQLLPWKKTTLIGHTVDLARSVTNNFVVVLGANAATIAPHVPETKWIVNDQWEQGMGSSLSHGVGYLQDTYAPEAILVMVVDQPLLSLAHYQNLILTHQKHPDCICSSSYQGRPGVPAIFPKSFLEKLKQLEADFGARKLMKTYRASVVLVATKGELIDLDTPEDYDSAFSRWGE